MPLTQVKIVKEIRWNLLFFLPTIRKGSDTANEKKTRRIEKASLSLGKSVLILLEAI